MNLEAHKWPESYPWAKIINPIVDAIIAYNKENPDNPFKILQIKEKFGDLRFYYEQPNLTEDELEGPACDIIESIEAACVQCREHSIFHNPKEKHNE